MSKLLSLMLLSSFLSCGPLDYVPEAGNDKVADVLHPPEQFDIKTANIAGSYIVTFRAPDKSKHLAFSSFRNESKYFYNRLLTKYLPKRGVTDIHFISSVSMAPQGKKGIWDEIPMPKSMQLFNQQNQNQNTQGVIAKVDFDSKEEAREILALWQKQGRIWFAEPNWTSQIVQEANTDQFATLSAEYGANNWHWIESMRISEGYKYISDEIAKGNLTESSILENAPVIAVMDSGVDYEHKALAGRIWTNESPGESDCPLDEHGCDLTFESRGVLGQGSTVHPFGVDAANTACPDKNEATNDVEAKIADNCFHGTHVAGIIGGSMAEGVPGICPFCQVMVLKVVSATINPGGAIPDNAILNSLKYVSRFVRNGGNAVRIVNASISKFQRSRAVSLLVNQLKTNSNGVLVIGAAGNEDTMTRAYPAALKDAIAVSSIENTGKKAIYSNFGPWVDVAAPGGNSNALIESTEPGGITRGRNGTSMAAPMVSGIAGILLAVDPTMSIADLRNRIIDTADQEIYSPDIAEAYNYNYYYKYIESEQVRIPLLGAGRVDLFSALTNEKQGINIEPYLNSRVESGCSVIGTPESGKNGLLGILILFIMPIILLTRKKIEL